MKILAMSDLVPEQICDIVRFTKYSGDLRISHYCGYAADFISMVLNEKDIDGAVYPKSCDSSRIIGSYLEDSKKFNYQICIPVCRKNIAITYFAEVLKDYKKNVEEHYAIKINNILDRTEKINLRNEKLKDIYSQIEEISYSNYLKSIHQLLEQPLDRQVIPNSFGNSIQSKKRVYLVGSFLSNLSIVDMIENCGMKIVGDNLPESGRLISTPDVNLSGDIILNVARSSLGKRLSPTQNNFKNIIEKDIKEIESKNVNGVIFIIQKYCEPYDYLFSVYIKVLHEMNIPVLKLILADSEDNRKVQLQLEAFADAI